MSEIQNDQQIQDKRTRKLDPEETDLRFKIPRDLMMKAKRKDLGERARRIWHVGNSERTEWLQRQETYLADWDEFIESTAEGPFEGSSSLHMPMPFIVTKTFHARMYQAIIGDDFRFPAKARREDASAREHLVSETIRYTLKDWANHYDGVESVLDDWVWAWCSTGVGPLKWRWEKEFTRFVDVVTVPKVTARFSVNEAGEEIPAPVVEFVEEEQAVVKKIFEGPVLETINVEDLLLIGGQGDPQKADIVQHRFWLTASKLNSLADQGIFNKESVDKAIDGGDNPVTGTIGGQLKEQRAFNSGKASADTTADLDRYEILETYWNIDIDDSGISSRIITWTHSRSSEILRATYLDRVSPDGKNPFTMAHFFRRKDQEMGIGLAEILHPLSVELDAIHNMRIDFGTMSNMPFGFIRANSSTEQKKMKIRPGTLIEVDNPQQDVFFPNLGNRTIVGFNEEGAMDRLVERLTGIGDLALGSISGRQGATRTATGSNIVQGNLNSNLDIHLKRLSRSWKKSLQFLFHLLQKRIPPELSFRITGEDGHDYWASVRDRSDLAGDFDFEIGTNSAQSDPTQRTQTAQQIFQLTNDPIAIQTGIVSPTNIFEARKNLFQALQVKDFHRYITKPQDHRIQISPQEELNRITHGIDVPIQLDMDHQGFLELWQRIQKSEELLGAFDQEQAVALARQAQGHQQALQSLEQLQAQARNRQQVGTNQQLGLQPPPAREL